MKKMILAPILLLCACQSEPTKEHVKSIIMVNDSAYVDTTGNVNVIVNDNNGNHIEVRQSGGGHSTITVGK